MAESSVERLIYLIASELKVNVDYISWNVTKTSSLECEIQGRPKVKGSNEFVLVYLSAIGKSINEETKLNGMPVSNNTYPSENLRTSMAIRELANRIALKIERAIRPRPDF